MKKFATLLLFVLLIYSLSSANALFNDSETVEKKLTASVIKIEQGDSVDSVFNKLVEKKLTKPRLRRLFKWWGAFKNYDRRLKVGDVEITDGAAIATIWELLKNPVQGTVRLTFIEGWDLRDIKKYLQDQNMSGAGNLYDITGKPPGAAMEGYLFPDTYEFFADATAADVIQKMQKTFDEKVPSNWKEEANSRHRTWKAAVIMASIIEKEVAGKEDRKIVSGIFWKRLDNGWPLQADSTVNYVTGEKKPSISAKEAQIDSLYNTYKYRGLPPTPIGNPSLEAIDAAVHPQDSAYWFFLTTPEGNVKYARTLKEHTANRRFLK